MANISVIGTGYVGLVSGTMFADSGHHVICCDNDTKKIESLHKNIVPLFEPGLSELICQNQEAGRLRFCDSIEEAVLSSDILFIAVGTPMADDGSADLSAVYSVAYDIGTYMDRYKIIVDKSTVPIGTSKRVSQIIAEAQAGRNSSIDFEVISNPEFLREGSAVQDFSNPDRIVIGCSSDSAFDLMKEVYMPQIASGVTILRTSPETAEMIKYASNAFLAVKISYINEIANLCEKVGADVHEVASAMGLDKRISPYFLQAGPGYGGSCFPKDTQAIQTIALEHGLDMRVIEAAIKANERQKYHMVEKIKDTIGSLEGKTIAILGITFKPLTDDMRDAPSLIIIPELIKAGAQIRIYDPECAKEAPMRFAEYESNILYCENEYHAAKSADALVLLTHWQQFKSLDFQRIKSVMHGSYFFDLRNIYEKKIVEKYGLTYFCVGR